MYVCYKNYILLWCCSIIEASLGFATINVSHNTSFVWSDIAFYDFLLHKQFGYTMYIGLQNNLLGLLAITALATITLLN